MFHVLRRRNNSARQNVQSYRTLPLIRSVHGFTFLLMFHTHTQMNSPLHPHPVLFYTISTTKQLCSNELQLSVHYSVPAETIARLKYWL